MKLAPPGGELSFWSAVWILLAVVWVYFRLTTGSNLYFAFAAGLGLPATGMWLGIRWSGYVMAVVCAVTIPLGLAALFFVDDTLSERAFRLFRLAMGGYFAWISFAWARDG